MANKRLAVVALLLVLHSIQSFWGYGRSSGRGCLLVVSNTFDKLQNDKMEIKTNGSARRLQVRRRTRIKKIKSQVECGWKVSQNNEETSDMVLHIRHTSFFTYALDYDCDCSCGLSRIKSRPVPGRKTKTLSLSPLRIFNLLSTLFYIYVIF